MKTPHTIDLSRIDYSKLPYDKSDLYQFKRWMQSPITYLTECCFTQDEVQAGRNEQAVVRVLPYLPHIQWLAQLWQEKQLLAIIKSRRMQFSWSSCALEDWLCNYTLGAKVGVIAQRQVTAEKFLARHVFIHSKLPEICPRSHIKIWKGVQGDPKKIDYTDTGSSIEAFPSTPEAIRSEGMTLVRLEEVQSWDEEAPNRTEKSWKAILPVVQGGGRVIAIGTPLAGTWYERLIKDQFEVEVGR